MAYIIQRSLPNAIYNFSTKIRKCPYLSNLLRTLTTSKTLASNYEGDGKTTVSILNREYKHLIMINSYSKLGFRLNNGIFTIGPLAAFPRTVLQWNVKSINEMTPECLSLFCLLEPKLDILIIGTGDKKLMLSKDVMQYLKANKIQPEIFATDQAVSIFNFLNTEGRCIAGAFIPPEEVVIYEEERMLLDNVEAIDDYSVQKSEKINT